MGATPEGSFFWYRSSTAGPYQALGFTSEKGWLTLFHENPSVNRSRSTLFKMPGTRAVVLILNPTQDRQGPMDSALGP